MLAAKARPDPSPPRTGRTIACGATLALEQRIPLLLRLASSGADISEGVAALAGWGHGSASAHKVFRSSADSRDRLRGDGVGPCADAGTRQTW